MMKLNASRYCKKNMHRCGQQRFVFGPAWYHTYQKAQSCILSLLSHCFDKQQPDNKRACRCFASISLKQALELSPNDSPTFQPSQLLSCVARRQTRVICPVTPWFSCVEKVASIEGQHASTAKRTCLQSCEDKHCSKQMFVLGPALFVGASHQSVPEVSLDISKDALERQKLSVKNLHDEIT